MADDFGDFRKDMDGRYRMLMDFGERVGRYDVQYPAPEPFLVLVAARNVNIARLIAESVTGLSAYNAVVTERYDLYR